METTKYIWMDGKFVAWDDAKVHILTHTLHYGMGVFEGIRFYETAKGPAIFRLTDHVNRLFDGAGKTFMKVPFKKADFSNAIVETVRKNSIHSGYIRPILYYGYGKMGLDPTGAPVNASIAVWPWGSYLGAEAVSVMTSSFIRLHPKSTDAGSKICGHYVNSIFASCEAKANGFQEALLLDYNGMCAEGPGENIFFVKNEVLYTPKLGNILSGITRDSVMRIAAKEGIKTIEKDISPKELKQSDEAFFTGTAAEITAIKKIDSTVIGNGSIGKITKKIRDIFLDSVSGKNKEYESWLTYVR